MFNREYATLRVTPRRFCVTVILSLHFYGSEEFFGAWPKRTYMEEEV